MLDFLSNSKLGIMEVSVQDLCSVLCAMQFLSSVSAILRPLFYESDTKSLRKSK